MRDVPTEELATGIRVKSIFCFWLLGSLEERNYKVIIRTRLSRCG